MLYRRTDAGGLFAHVSHPVEISRLKVAQYCIQLMDEHAWSYFGYGVCGSDVHLKRIL